MTQINSILINLKKILNREYWTLRRITLLSIALIVIGVCLFATVRTQLTIVPTYQAQSHRVDTPFKVTLNQRINSVSLEHITISPAVQGDWKLEEGSLLVGDSLVFTPADHFTANTKYIVSLPTIKRTIAGTAVAQSLTFTTEQAPSLARVGLGTLANAQTIPADYIFHAELSSPNRGLRSLELRTKPALALTHSSKEDRQFNWSAKDTLPQGQAVEVEIYDLKNKVSLLRRTIKVADEPQLKTPEKTTHYKPGDAVELEFAQPMDAKQTAKIDFSVPGEGSWKNDTVYRFIPQDLKPGQSYQYTAAQGLRSKQGGVSTKAYTGSIAAIGPVQVLRTTPQGRELAQASQRISFSFDQPVDKASAAERLRISSGTVERVEWNDTTMTATVINLGYQKTVTASIEPGVKNIGFGLPSTRAFAVSFTTEVRSNRLTIPYFRQQYAASCTAASLRMILAQKGIATSDMAIVERMGYNPRPMDKSTNPGTWDDPNEMFVGDVNGSIRGGTGAGPDAQPVAKAARSFGRNASAVTGVGISWVAEQLHDGNPVVLFGAISGSGYVEWKTPSGSLTKMHVTGHARTVTGVIGEPSDPIGFWVHDPLYGTQYWTAGSLAANIALDPYRQAVVVY